MAARVLLVLVLLLGAVACGGDADNDDEGTTVASGDGCEQVDAPEPKQDGGQTKPDGPLTGPPPALVFSTNCGDFTVQLDAETAPNTAASLVMLAENGFYDDTIIHRIVPQFVIQGGDPTGTGSGGPGYKTVDKPPADARYTKGVVAMAKTGAEPAGTSGSQFFVVTGDDIGLPPDYAIVGEVTGGLDVVEHIGTLGDASEQPTETIVIQSVRVQG
jgi:peptidyl-prolyl cis-trans isomerase B (cyclophilin B)